MQDKVDKFIGAAKVKKGQDKDRKALHRRMKEMTEYRQTAKRSDDDSTTTKDNAGILDNKDKSANSFSSKFDDDEHEYRESKVDVGILFSSYSKEDTAAKDSSMTVIDNYPHHFRKLEEGRSGSNVIRGGRPSNQVVVCENGNATLDNGTVVSCKEACDGSCCIGGYVSIRNAYLYAPACEGLTASICKDNVTCIGGHSCSNTNVKSIYLGCNGMKACYKTGYFNGYVGSIHNGCRGYIACAMLAYINGRVNSIINSCVNGDRSCYAVAKNYGYVNSMVDSCNDATDVCYGAALGRYIRGESIGGYYIGSTFTKSNINLLTESCNGANSACRLAGSFGGKIDSITNSCNFGESSCHGIAKSGGVINFINNSCLNSTGGCFYAAAGTFLSDTGGPGGSITSITSSCNSNNACLMIAYRGEIRGGINWSCNNHKSCYGAGASTYRGRGTGNITSAIMNCCNKDEECYKANETTLPVECGNTYLPWGTFSPTTSSVSPTTSAPASTASLKPSVPSSTSLTYAPFDLSSSSPTKSPIDTANFASESPTLLVPNSAAVLQATNQISAAAILLGFVVVIFGGLS